MSLPSVLSPCDNVRRSCENKMRDPLINGMGNPKEKNNQRSTCSEKSARPVVIDERNLFLMANGIAQSILSHPNQKNFVEWDEHSWHYTGKMFHREKINDHKLSKEEIELMRNERVALYVLTLDAMNFCFWPAHDDNLESMENLEYHHLAKALKRVAELDDIIDDKAYSPAIDNMNKNDIKNGFIVSESTYKLSPDSLSNMTVADLESLLDPFLPFDNQNQKIKFPNLEERCRLLNELGMGLIYLHSSSALALLQKANRSADKLVSLILASFSGFRDEAVDIMGKKIYFYKRAQIAVADLKAALGTYPIKSKNDQNMDYQAYSQLADFQDMDHLTTFADYRIPQLLRHRGILKYAIELGENKIDRKIELMSGNEDEIYIRAATVVAVDLLVNEVNSLLKKKLEQEEYKECDIELLNAVKMDWYLWQQGEKLENEKKMLPHHRVNTIYY